jgi:hypothetical protein
MYNLDLESRALFLPNGVLDFFALLWKQKSPKPPRDACAANRSLTIFYPLCTQSRVSSILKRGRRLQRAFFYIGTRPKILSQFAHFEWRYGTFGYMLNF